MASRRQMGGIGGKIPPFTKKTLVFLLGLYVVELLASSWFYVDVVGLFAWNTNGLFQIWQPLTNYFIQGSNPINALLSLLMVYFFMPTLQSSFGRRGIYRMIIMTVILNLVFCSLMLATNAIPSGGLSNQMRPGMGIGPFITAAIVIFGLSRPNAQILLFFVLPIQALWIAWGTGILSGLFFLTSRDIGSAMWLGGFMAGWVFMNWPKKGGLSGILRNWKHKRTQQRLRRFTVIDGGKDKDIFH